MTARSRLVVLLLLVFGVVGSAQAELGLRFGVEDFRWREYGSGGRLLEESGPRWRVGADWRHAFRSDRDLSLEVSGSFYFGTVDYDGQACNLAGSCVPYQSDTRYRGLQGEGLLVRSFAGTGLLLLGGGVDTWRRDIRGDSSVSGAVEDWTVFYVLAGGGAQWGDAPARYSLRAGLKLPFYTIEDPHSADVILEPEGTLSPFVRFTVDFARRAGPRWGLGVYYDSYRFDESDRERTGSLIIWQPESHQDVIGMYGIIYLR